MVIYFSKFYQFFIENKLSEVKDETYNTNAKFTVFIMSVIGSNMYTEVKSKPFYTLRKMLGDV